VVTLSTFADVAGFAGAVIILAGFGYHTVRNAAPDRLYHLANFSGAGLLAVSLMIHYNLPALCLELAWAAVALFGLMRSVEKKQ
jgi:predicted exporter